VKILSNRSVARIIFIEDYADEWLWRNKDLPLLPGQEQELPFKATSKMVGVNE